MAKQVITRLVDDLDGSEAAETVTFGMDGVAYTIDLSEANAAALREVFAPYVAAGSKISKGASVGVFASRSKLSDSRAELAKIRQWAGQNGVHVAARGRIPDAVRRQYEASRASFVTSTLAHAA